MVSLQQILEWFKTGLFPTQEQFEQTWRSFWHKWEKIPGTQIEGFPALTPDGIETQIKIWIGMEDELPVDTERSETKTLYIALLNEEELP